jgi:hypothetical protein
MSSDESVLGFTNKWYKEGIDRAISVPLNPIVIRIFSLPYFLGTKMEAFKGRGNGDYRASPDMEDIISILEVAQEKLWGEGFSASSRDFRTYLKNELEKLKGNPNFLDALPGAVFNRELGAAATESVLNQINQMIEKCGS